MPRFFRKHNDGEHHQKKQVNRQKRRIANKRAGPRIYEFQGKWEIINFKRVLKKRVKNQNQSHCQMNLKEVKPVLFLKNKESHN